MQFKRSDRVSEEIRKIISSVVEEDLRDHSPGLVTFTHVKITKDLRIATVYYSHLGTDEQREWTIEYFERERRRLRKLLGDKMRIRRIPELNFKFDPSIEEGIRIEKLLNDIKREKEDRS